MLRGLEGEDWRRVRQVVAEVHSTELLESVRAMLEAHYSRVTVVQDDNMGGSQLYLVYATLPVASDPAGR